MPWHDVVEGGVATAAGSADRSYQACRPGSTGDLLKEVLNRSGRREKRVRRLLTHVMLRYVIAMELFCVESSDEAMPMCRLVGSLHRLLVR